MSDKKVNVEKANVEQEFNDKAADAAGGSEARGAEARAARRRRSRNSVVDYADALAAAPNDNDMKVLLEEQEELMAPFADDPANYDNVINYGSPPLQAIGKVGIEMLRVQKGFYEQANVMNDAINRMRGTLDGMNLAEWAQATSRLTKGFVKGTAKGIIGFVKGTADVLTGANAKRTEDEKLVRKMQEELPKMQDEVAESSKNLEGAYKASQQVYKEAEKLAIARIEALRGINVYLGTRKELMRRYNEEYIPEAKQFFEESQNPDDQEYLDNVIKRAEQLAIRLLRLEASALDCRNSVQNIKIMMDGMEDNQATIQDLLTNGKNEWFAKMAEAGIAGSSLKISQGIQAAHGIGDKLNENTLKMIEQTHEMNEIAKNRGTVDTKKLLEGTERMKELVEKHYKNNSKRLERAQKDSDALREAGQKLIAAVDAAQTSRMLEAAERAGEETGSKPQTANDNASEQPTQDVAAPSAPRNRRGGPKL